MPGETARLSNVRITRLWAAQLSSSSDNAGQQQLSSSSDNAGQQLLISSSDNARQQQLSSSSDTAGQQQLSSSSSRTDSSGTPASTLPAPGERGRPPSLPHMMVKMSLAEASQQRSLIAAAKWLLQKPRKTQP